MNSLLTSLQGSINTAAADTTQKYTQSYGYAYAAYVSTYKSVHKYILTKHFTHNDSEVILKSCALQESYEKP